MLLAEKAQYAHTYTFPAESLQMNVHATSEKSGPRAPPSIAITQPVINALCIKHRIWACLREHPRPLTSKGESWAKIILPHHHSPWSLVLFLEHGSIAVILWQMRLLCHWLQDFPQMYTHNSQSAKSKWAGLIIDCHNVPGLSGCNQRGTETLNCELLAFLFLGFGWLCQEERLVLDFPLPAFWTEVCCFVPCNHTGIGLMTWKVHSSALFYENSCLSYEKTYIWIPFASVALA